MTLISTRKVIFKSETVCGYTDLVEAVSVDSQCDVKQRLQYFTRQTDVIVVQLRFIAHNQIQHLHEIRETMKLSLDLVPEIHSDFALRTHQLNANRFRYTVGHKRRVCSTSGRTSS